MGWIDYILIAIYVVLAATLLTVLWALVHGLRHGQGYHVINGVKARRIFRVVMGATILAIIITLAAASTTPLAINGEAYDNKLWLRVSDACMYTLAIMMVGALATVLWANIKSRLGK